MLPSKYHAAIVPARKHVMRDVKLMGQISDSFLKLVKGKPPERGGRNATGLNPLTLGQGGRATGQVKQLHDAVKEGAREPAIGANPPT